MNELQNRPIELLFEELENITLAAAEVNELVTDLKNIVMDQLTCIVMDQLTWRSVEDGLPDKQGNFFVCTPRSFPKNIPFQVAEFYDDNNTFYNEYDSPLEDVTHWLPIPKLD